MANDAVWIRFITELLDKNDIVDVISSYIDVKPKGRGYWALCPFHNDRNPSLSINREGQYFHCFVCGCGGNAIGFVMKFESCTYMEAVETLAKRVGLEVPRRGGGDEKALSLKKRNGTFITTFAAKQPAFIMPRLCRTRARPPANIWKAGESALRQSSVSVWVILPTGTLSGCIFRKRALKQRTCKRRERSTKPETSVLRPAVRKNHSAHCQHGGKRGCFRRQNFQRRGRREIQEYRCYGHFRQEQKSVCDKFSEKCKQEGRLEYIIVVEGYMDVIALNQAGFDMTVASMGTALTAEQARLASRLTKDVYICYDGDKAGQAATLRGLDILKKRD